MHRFCLGVYALHERFVTEFPHVRFEGCSGGGGRFDLGILFFCAQVWASDNTDPVARMRIQYGTSYIFPALTVGAHYSTAPNHITQGTTRKRTRALVAMCGTFGYELDLRKVPPNELQAMRRQVAAHRLISPVVRNGELYRLWDPFRCDYCAWMYVTLEHAAVFAFNLSSRFWSDLVPRLHLRGLDPNSLYDVTEPLPNNRMQKSGTLEVIHAGCDVYQLGAPRVRMYGATLMAIGIPLRFLTQDDSLMFLLTKCLDEDESDADAAICIAKQPTDFNP
jgi:alpha-galactosidase